MIDFLGVGVPDGEGGWLLHRVCARLPAGSLIVAVSSRQRERGAVAGVITGDLVPEEGLASVRGVAVTAQSQRRMRTLVADVEVGLPLVDRRSVLWNVLAPATPGVALRGLLRIPRRAVRQAAVGALERVGLEAVTYRPVSEVPVEDRARVLLARALMRQPECLVVRDVDLTLDESSAEAFLGRLAHLARVERLTVLATLASPALARRVADRLLVIADGLLVFDDVPARLPVTTTFAPPARV